MTQRTTIVGSSLFRKRSSAAAGAVSLCLALAATVPARAQFFFPPAPWSMSSEDIAQTLRDRGYHLLVPPYRNGNVYVVDAVDARGIQERLVVDAYQGTIVQRFRTVARAQPRYEAPSDLPFPGEENNTGERSVPYDPYSSGEPVRRPLHTIPRDADAAWPDNNAVPERTARAPGEADVQPNVVPGLGPDATGAETPKPKVKRQVKKVKTPESQVVRATPLPPPDKPVGAAPAMPQAAPATPPPAQTAAPPPAPAKPATVAATSSPPPPVKKPPVQPKAPLNDIPPAPLD
jgi:hypothetical protein